MQCRKEGEVASQTLPHADIRDLGFGSVVAEESRLRLLNRDGSFNVNRTGLSFRSSLSPYHALLTMSWLRFHSAVAAFYLTANTAFALSYYLCGPQALEGPGGGTPWQNFLKAFFFSVQTIATIGFGHIHPIGILVNVVVTAEALFGLLSFALATGLLFARFSRPTARILFSDRAVVAPYHGMQAFEFRIANARKNQMIDLAVQLLFSRMEGSGSERVRRFHNLPLEREKVAFFPLSWTVVHPIDSQSPLRGLTPHDLAESEAEFLVLLTGTDETFSQTVHARSSYKPSEITWNARFVRIFNQSVPGQPISIDIRRLSSIEALSATAIAES